MKTKILIAAFLSLCLTSCASLGHSITQPKVNQIQPGQTSEADLVGLFGPPTTKFIDMRGVTSLDWFRSVGPPVTGYFPLVGSFLGGLHTHVQQLSVVLGSDGRVANYTIYDSNGEVRKGTTRSTTVTESSYRK